MDKDLGLRRPELDGVERVGTVRWFKQEKGYGRITADDGEVLFVHFSDVVAAGYRLLEEGQRVRFVWRGGVVDHGRHHAEDVRVVGWSPDADGDRVTKGPSTDLA
jgi:CspA family cold shock protein